MLRAAVILVAALVARSAGAVVVTDYFVAPPGSGGGGIAGGPDGNVWFTGVGGSSIHRVTPDGLVTRYVLPHDEATPGPGPYGIVAGPDGKMWFTETYMAAWGGNKIGRIDPASGSITEFPLPTPDAHPSGIAVGSDGALWFTEPGASKIGRITTSGSITEFPVSAAASAITSGPDGALWVTNQSGVSRLTTSGVETAFPLPWQVAASGIAVGPDSRLWFLSYHAAAGGPGMVRMDLDGTYDVFPLLPGSNPGGGIAAGPDGNLWFANGIARLGRMTVHGLQTDVRLATASVTVQISAGPDGNVWFTEGDYVGRVDLGSAGYYTMLPCRVIDTRRSDFGANGAPALAAGSTRMFTIAGYCGVPIRGTVALTVNLTVVNATGSGSLRVFPYGFPQPASSNLSFQANVTRANNAVLTVDLDGRVSVFCDVPDGGETDFVVDVVGYFE
ncbi:MAG: hypothetical protein IPP07_05665 [Holophagales bacterium]|nr:hypothetical protein [Holophagales bacterium]